MSSILKRTQPAHSQANAYQPFPRILAGAPSPHCSPHPDCACLQPVLGHAWWSSSLQELGLGTAGMRQCGGGSDSAQAWRQTRALPSIHVRPQPVPSARVPPAPHLDRVHDDPEAASGKDLRLPERVVIQVAGEEMEMEGKVTIGPQNPAGVQRSTKDQGRPEAAGSKHCRRGQAHKLLSRVIFLSDSYLSHAIFLIASKNEQLSLKPSPHLQYCAKGSQRSPCLRPSSGPHWLFPRASVSLVPKMRDARLT